MSELKKIDFKTASFPVFSEVLQRQPWVYFGLDNMLPQYMINLYDSCAIHKAIIKSKVNQVMGDSISCKEDPSVVFDCLLITCVKIKS